MNKYFNILLEFNHQVFENTINNAINNNTKGYVCIVDGNVLATATKNITYREIINGAMVNSCDGSSIAFLASKIHKQNLKTNTGPDIFSKYVKDNYKQYFIGNTEENIEILKSRFIELGYDTHNFNFDPLPFKRVEDFEYLAIANKINKFSPDIIWVSLGAPKQELFISKLYPHINKGVLFAIGAALNLFLGDGKNKRAPQLMIRFHLEWLFRVFQEPKRIGKRALNYIFILPELIFKEIIKIKKH